MWITFSKKGYLSTFLKVLSTKFKINQRILLFLNLTDVPLIPKYKFGKHHRKNKAFKKIINAPIISILSAH